MRSKGRGAALLTLAMVLLAATGHAQSLPERGAAEVLFDDGRRLMEAKRFDEACEKFEKSQLIEPAVGTLLNLGDCLARVGKMASAWTRYREAGNLAVKLGDRRAQLAGERASAVEPRLSRLTIRISEPNRTDGLEILKDGLKVDTVLIETAIPVDAGRHVLSASAPGRTPWRQELELKEGESVDVEVPALENDGTLPPPVAIDPAPRPAPVPQRPAPAEVPTRPVPPVVYVLGGVAIAGAAAGTYFGLDARAKKSDAEETCSPLCTEQTIDDAQRSALFCDLSLGIALVSAATGATLFFTRPTVYVTHDAAWFQVDASF